MFHVKCFHLFFIAPFSWSLSEVTSIPAMNYASMDVVKSKCDNPWLCHTNAFDLTNVTAAFILEAREILEKETTDTLVSLSGSTDLRVAGYVTIERTDPSSCSEVYLRDLFTSISYFCLHNSLTLTHNLTLIGGNSIYSYKWDR